MGKPHPEYVQSIERGLTLLEELSRETGGLGVTELARRTKLPVSTAHRLLSVFVRRGYISRSGRRYACSADGRLLGLGLLPVGLLSSMYDILTGRFDAWMSSGEVEEVFWVIDGRSLSLRAVGGKGGGTCFLVPGLGDTSTNGCRAIRHGNRVLSCRLLAGVAEETSYRLDRKKGTWCMCVWMSSGGEACLLERVGARGEDSLSKDRLMALSSTLTGVCEDLGGLGDEHKRGGNGRVSVRERLGAAMMDSI